MNSLGDLVIKQGITSCSRGSAKGFGVLLTNKQPNISPHMAQHAACCDPGGYR